MKALLVTACLLASSSTGLGLLTLLLDASAGAGACPTLGSGAVAASGQGGWTATAYGPPWGGIEGDGITATGHDLRAGQPAYEIAVDPRVIPLGSWVYVQPNPFDTSHPFYAGDTGGAILGRHVDIYDWRGRVSQNAWGSRRVSVTPAPAPTRGELPTGVARSGPGTAAPAAAECEAAGLGEDPTLTPGQTARIAPDGSASAPADAPIAVRRAIAAGNLIHTKPYPQPDVHYGTLERIWPAYDCSGSVSFVLYAAGLLRAEALDSGALESYGQPGPGKWITVYANPAHTWIVVAGIALDTADSGGPAIPPGSGPRWRSQPLANLGDGSRYVVRHPAGF